MRYPGFINGTGALAAAKINAERTVNLYPEQTKPGTSLNEWWLRPTPGKRKLWQFPTGPVRNLFWKDGRGYALSGDRFYEFDAAHSYVQRGVVNNDTRPGWIVSNGAIGNQVFLGSGMAGYIWNFSTNTFTPIADPDFPAACLNGAFADSYFLALYNGTPKFGFSSLGNGLVWDALDVLQKSQTADNIVSMIYHQKEVLLLGTETGEVVVNVGDPDNPWTPRPVLIENGIAAQDSWAVGANSVFWLAGGSNKKAEVVMLTGYQTLPIGTQAVHEAINGYSRVDDALGYYYEEVGHKFYVLTFPTAQHTWCYDVTTGLWHERLYWNSGSAVYEADLARCHTVAFTGANKTHLVGSRVDGSVYELVTPTVNQLVDDDGVAIRRMRRAPCLAAEGLNVGHRRFEIEMVTGVGTSTGGQGSDPHMFMRYSDDGGDTWSAERWAAMGPYQQTKRRVYWTRLGSATERVYEVVTSDPVFLGMLDAYINPQPGIH